MSILSALALVRNIVLRNLVRQRAQHAQMKRADHFLDQRVQTENDLNSSKLDTGKVAHLRGEEVLRLDPIAEARSQSNRQKSV